MKSKSQKPALCKEKRKNMQVARKQVQASLAALDDNGRS
jgi:hypothetical protein